MPYATLSDTLTDSLTDIAQQIDEALEGLWAVVVHDDDVTTFATVITALMRLFEYSHDDAEQLAWVVHTKGKAVVAVLAKDEASAKVQALGSYHITASAAPA